MKKIFTLALLVLSIATTSDAQVISSVKPSFSFSVYPNPAIDEISIAVAAIEHAVEMNIYNAVGDLVYNKMIASAGFQSPVKIDLRDFQRGMYVVQLSSADVKISRKLLLK